MEKNTCPFSGTKDYKTVFVYHKRPLIETPFPFTEGKYYREIRQFDVSKHFMSVHEMDIEKIYTDDYVAATYKDEEGILKTFNKIINLPPEKSDNVARVKNIVAFCNNYFQNNTPKEILDVGSGLGVFPYEIKKYNWDCVALDPDQQAAKHIRNVVGIETICDDFFKLNLDKKFDVVTFNKVLEHVNDPIAMLQKSKDYLKPNGIVYIELPDGEIAMKDGKEREEFCIEHIHVFSFTSLSMLIDLAGFETIYMERLQEPSTKYTLRAFVRISSHN